MVAAGQRDSPRRASALEALCRAYWYPLYVFVRRQGHTPEDAQDLTQEFFCRLFEKDQLGQADQGRGKFRTFLLVSLKHFLINEWKRARRLRRGGGVSFLSLDALEPEARYAEEPVDESSPSQAYEREWAVTLIEHVFSLLRAEYAADGKAPLFAALKGGVWGETRSASYAELGRQLSMTEGAVKVAVHRLRRRFREVLRAEAAHTVARAEDIDEELRHLISVLS